MYITRY